LRNKILALYYMERKTWFCFPVEYDGENLFSPWSKILDCAAHRSYRFGQRCEPLVASFQTSASYSPVRRLLPSKAWQHANTVCVQSYGKTISKKNCSVPCDSRRTYRAKKRNVLALVRVVSYTRPVVLCTGGARVRCTTTSRLPVVRMSDRVGQTSNERSGKIRHEFISRW
jgi:hypothetical protein